MNRFFLATIALLTFGVSSTSVLSANKGTVIEITAPVQHVMLQQSVRIEGKIIYIGDIFSNAGDKADIALAYAPKPGKRAVYDARWLSRVAKAYQLNWRPLSHRDRVVVQRASNVITQDEIAEKLREALADRGVDPDMEIHFSNRQLRLHVGGDVTGEIGFDDIVYDRRSNRFTAVIHVPAGDSSAPRTRITGQLFPTTELPVAARRLLKGDIINESDLRWLRVRTDRLQNDAVSNLQDLVGKSPRRGLREGQPIRMSSIQDPVLVEKGSLVTIVLRARKMYLTAQGKAMQSGSNGDVIRISNTQSNKTIEAEIVGAGRVAVRQSTHLVLN